jgi:DNA-binding XRE family transcriptional regulator
MTSPKGSRTRKRFNVDNELTRWRRELNISQYEAATLIGIAQPHYSMIERGKCKPTNVLATVIRRLVAGQNAIRTATREGMSSQGGNL